MKNSQRSQELVKLSTEKEGEEFISFLEHKGLLNINHINFEVYELIYSYEISMWIKWTSISTENANESMILYSENT